MVLVVGLSQTHGSDSTQPSLFKRGGVVNVTNHPTLAPVASDRAPGSSQSRAQSRPDSHFAAMSLAVTQWIVRPERS